MGSSQRLPGPVFLPQTVVIETLCLQVLGDLECRPDGPVPDPLRQDFNLFVRQAIVGGHLELGIGLPNRLDQQARFRIADDNGPTASAPLQQTVVIVDTQAPGRLVVGGVAVVAIVDQQRPNLLFKELQLRGIGFGDLAEQTLRGGQHQPDKQETKA